MRRQDDEERDGLQVRSIRLLDSEWSGLSELAGKLRNETPSSLARLQIQKYLRRHGLLKGDAEGQRAA